MSRIGGVGQLGTDQLRALRRLQEVGLALSANLQRLATLRRINAAKDDPAGIVQIGVLESELSAAEAASRSLTRAGSLLNLADATAGEVVSQLQSARALVLEAAGGTLSSSEVAANQVQVDAILGEVDRLARTGFSGRQLLNGASGFSTSGVDTAQVLDVDVLDKTTAEDVTVDIEITAQASQAQNSFTTLVPLSEETTVIIEGPDGTTTITLAAGSTVQDIADAFNDVSYLTGITAAVDGLTQVDFATEDYGSAASISIEATQGSFDLDTPGTVYGTDAVATINGRTFTGGGSTFNVNTGRLALVVEIDPTAGGTLTPFVVTGSGLEFSTGPSPADSARIGLPNLTTSSLGGVTGKLSSIRSGGTNSLTAGHAEEALRIIDDALADALRGQAQIGGFQKFTIDTSGRVVGSTIENLSSALSAVRDTDVALETSLLTKNQLLQQSALETLSFINLRNGNVLNLLKSALQEF